MKQRSWWMAALSAMLLFSFANYVYADETGYGFPLGIKDVTLQTHGEHKDKHACAVDLSSNKITGKAVKAIADGVVVEVGENTEEYDFGYNPDKDEVDPKKKPCTYKPLDWGRYVKICDNKPCSGMTHLYAHLSEMTDTLKAGVKVKKGDTIGKVGKTGCSKGAHLHLSFYKTEEKVETAFQIPYTTEFLKSYLTEEGLRNFKTIAKKKECKNTVIGKSEGDEENNDSIHDSNLNIVNKPLLSNCNNIPFNDVYDTDDEICYAVKFLVDNGIASQNSKFRPNDSISRGEMAKFLALGYDMFKEENYEQKLCEKKEPLCKSDNYEICKLSLCPKSISCDKDDKEYKSHTTKKMVGKVPEVFKPHIEKIRALEFTNACPYMWNEPVTRAQMAKFLVKLAESTGIQPIKRTGCTPRDVGDELGDLKEFITTLTQYGYNEGGKTKGITNACEKYRPNDSVTRGEMARFLYRLLYKTQPVFSAAPPHQETISQGDETISQGEKIDNSREIAKDQTFTVKTTWLGSDVDIVVTTPGGQVLTPDSDIVKDFHEGATEEYYVIEANETGIWKFTLIGVDIPEPEPYTFSITFDSHNVQNYELSGQMLDKSGNPMANAVVKVGDKTTVADEMGYWKISELPTGTYTVIISKDGNIIASKNVTVEGDNPTIEVSVDWVEPASCRMYAVHDEGRNHSLFFTIDVLDNFDVKLLGTMYHKHDIESLAIHPSNNQLFAAAGKDGLEPGYLYAVNANTGAISPIGDTGFRDINGLSFKPDDGTLWGWAKGDGLIQIDIATAKGVLELPYKGAIEDITWNNAGTILYGVMDNTFLAYDNQTKTAKVLDCTVTGGEIEALEMMPGDADNKLLFSMHNDNTLSIRSINVDSCEQAEVNISTALEGINLNDVEGIALPKEACTH